MMSSVPQLPHSQGGPGAHRGVGQSIRRQHYKPTLCPLSLLLPSLPQDLPDGDSDNHSYPQY